MKLDKMEGVEEGWRMREGRTGCVRSISQENKRCHLAEPTLRVYRSGRQGVTRMSRKECVISGVIRFSVSRDPEW